jgi:cell volume regulation protein A
MAGLEYILLIGSALILLSIAIAKVTDNLGVPVLVLFLGVGMLAGSEGPGGIAFDDPHLASSIGIIALIFILFSGGLDTHWPSVRPVVWKAASLSTLGVLITAVLVGVFTHLLLGFSLLHGLLLGSVISSTDAAAVFSVLRSKHISLRGQLKPLLELESGSNDPMAVFLTLGLIEATRNPETTVMNLALLFFVQMTVGAVVGIGLGKAMVFLLNRIRFSYEGFYPVFSLAFASLIYGVAAVAGGSGFLAVYLAGIIVGNSEFVQKKTLFRFFDGLAWLSQIGMFLTLGLLVFPSELMSVVGAGLLVSAFLMFLARPLAVLLSLALAKVTAREKLLVSWVGLRGAVPIILATFPLMAGIPQAEAMFNLVFFIVLTSTLFQGWSIPLVARWLGVDAPYVRKRRYPIEFAPMDGVDADIVDFIVPYNSAVIGKSIVELGLPSDSLVVLINRNERYIVPSGGTVLEEGDTILVLTSSQSIPRVREILSRQREKPAESPTTGKEQS